MMDFRQSEAFATYLEASGWKTVRLAGGTFVYIFRLPILGNILRIPRPKAPVAFSDIDRVAQEAGAVLVKIEPDAQIGDLQLSQELKKNGYIFDQWTIEPTKTTIVNLKQSEDQLFWHLRPKWRQYIRLAKKHGVSVRESDRIDQFIDIWHENARQKGYTIERPQKTIAFWKEFKKRNAAKLFFASIDTMAVAGVLIVVWQGSAHLWHMAYNGTHEKLHPVRLVVWESLLRAKAMGLWAYDFEGILDERLPYTQNVQPTLFKRGFGGFEKSYIGSFVKYQSPFRSLPFVLLGKIHPELIRILYKKMYG